MQQLIIKKNISTSKVAVLLGILKSWEVEVEFLNIPHTVKNQDNNTSCDDALNFGEAIGMWKDYKIDSRELRKKAWGKNNEEQA